MDTVPGTESTVVQPDSVRVVLISYQTVVKKSDLRYSVLPAGAKTAWDNRAILCWRMHGWHCSRCKSRSCTHVECISQHGTELSGFMSRRDAIEADTFASSALAYHPPIGAQRLSLLKKTEQQLAAMYERHQTTGLEGLRNGHLGPCDCIGVCTCGTCTCGGAWGEATGDEMVEPL